MVNKAKSPAQADRARLLVHEDAVACLVAVDAVAKEAPEPVLEQVRSILREATERITEAASAREPDAVVVKLSARRKGEYFPKQEAAGEPSAQEIDEADAYWRGAAAQQTRFRDEALAQVGPLLPPKLVAERLGVSRATVANWRAHGKLLGIRFDDHEYVFPAWQFVSSPSEGERGVVRHLDEVSAALGEAHPWDKAKFFLTRLPSLGDRRPIDVLRSGSPDEVTLLVQLARQRGEIGS
jgi:hypothetical protein